MDSIMSISGTSKCTRKLVSSDLIVHRFLRSSLLFMLTRSYSSSLDLGIKTKRMEQKVHGDEHVVFEVDVKARKAELLYSIL